MGEQSTTVIRPALLLLLLLLTAVGAAASLPHQHWEAWFEDGRCPRFFQVLEPLHSLDTQEVQLVPDHLHNAWN